MIRRVAALALILLAAAAPAFSAQTQSVTIASFNFTPANVAVAVGDTVSWTNLDPVVHTVTADRGEFISGSLHQGQTYSIRFNKPGVFPYFCEPHDFMRGQITVSGTAPPPPAPTTTRTTMAAPPASATADPAATVTTVAETTTSLAPTASTVAEPASAETPVQSAGGVESVVSNASVSVRRDVLPPALIALAIAIAAAVAVAVLVNARLAVGHATRYVAAALTVVAAVFHLQLFAALHYPDPIDMFMVIAAAAGTLVAAYLVTSPWSWTMFLAGAGFHVVSIGAFVIARVGPGLFGYHEIGWDPSPQAAGAIAAEGTALALLGFTVWLENLPLPAVLRRGDSR